MPRQFVKCSEKVVCSIQCTVVESLELRHTRCKGTFVRMKITKIMSSLTFIYITYYHTNVQLYIFGCTLHEVHYRSYYSSKFLCPKSHESQSLLIFVIYDL